MKSAFGTVHNTNGDRDQRNSSSDTAASGGDQITSFKIAFWIESSADCVELLTDALCLASGFSRWSGHNEIIRFDMTDKIILIGYVGKNGSQSLDKLITGKISIGLVIDPDLIQIDRHSSPGAIRNKMLFQHTPDHIRTGKLSKRIGELFLTAPQMGQDPYGKLVFVNGVGEHVVCTISEGIDSLVHIIGRMEQYQNRSGVHYGGADLLTIQPAIAFGHVRRKNNQIGMKKRQ